MPHIQLPLLVVRCLLNMRSQHNLQVPLRHPRSHQDRAYLSPELAGTMGAPRQAVLLPMLDHDVDECCDCCPQHIGSGACHSSVQTVCEIGYQEVEEEAAGMVEST